MDLSHQVRNALRRCSAASALALVTAASAATVPLYENNGPLISPPTIAPQIDARAWVNRSLFDMSTATGLPYESQNTLFFTNTTSGQMFVNPGLRFFRNTGGQRLSMDTWVNEGRISAVHDSFSSGIFFQDSRASILQVLATNITSRGPLSAGEAGVVRLEGKRISVPRIGIRTGPSLESSGAIFGTSFLGASNYVNDIGVSDVYWAVGTNNSVRAGQNPMVLNSFFGIPNFNLPIPSSPFHDVISRTSFGTLFTNRISIPGSFFFFGTNLIGSLFANGFAAATHTNIISQTSSVVQVVFYPTNSDPLASTEVRFVGGFGLSDVIVGFHSVDFDIATQTGSTNSVYLVDALPTTTNAFLARNQAGSTRRPSTFEVTRTQPFGYFSSVLPNATFSSNLIFGSQLQLQVVTNAYTAYAAQIANLGFSASGSIPYDVTNVPGRVEILGDEINLEQTRIRSESALIIKTDNLISNRLAQVDTPLINFDVRSKQSVLVISNLAPSSVRRFSGGLQAWSSRWENNELVNNAQSASTTNTVLFHVLIVDSQLQGSVPVVINEFAIRGSNHVVSDFLTIRKSILVEGDSLHLTAGLATPFGYGLGASNFVGLRHFTNDGVINLNGFENFGFDRSTPYQNYINRGTNAAYSHFIRALNIDNPGCLVASGGPLTVDALTVKLQGLPYVAFTNVFTNFFFQFPGTITNVFTNVLAVTSPPKLDSVSEVRLNIRDLALSNAWINAGALVVSVTNSLVDGGSDGPSSWNVTNGFQVLRKPATSSLLGTHVRSTVPSFGASDHSWAGTDLGSNPAGYTNNLAVGKLTLDGGPSSLFAFRPIGAANAIYVDYLELLNTATNYNNQKSPDTYAIDSGFTLYFANANVSAEKLNNALGGRFRWVSDFAGPLSSTNLYYESTGKTYTFNIALVQSKDLDSDGDGIANADDPEPIYVPESAFLTVALAAVPNRSAVLSWSALANSSNFVEYKDTPGPATWQVLTNFVHGPFTMPVSLMDPLPSGGASRIYRLRVEPLKP